MMGFQVIQDYCIIEVLLQPLNFIRGHQGKLEAKLFMVLYSKMWKLGEIILFFCRKVSFIINAMSFVLLKVKVKICPN